MDITAERQRDADAYGKLCDAADEREREVEMFATDLVKFARLGEMDISIHGNTRSKYVGNSVYAQTPEPIWQTLWEAVEADEKFQKRLMNASSHARPFRAAMIARSFFQSSCDSLMPPTFVSLFGVFMFGIVSLHNVHHHK